MVDLQDRTTLQSAGSPRPPAREADRFAPGNARWLQTGLLWLGLVASLASIHPLFTGAAWWFAGAAAAGVVLFGGATLRAFHWPNLAAFVGAGVLGLFAVTLSASGGTALLGIVPTAATIDRARLLAAAANESIVADQAPVQVSDALLAVVVVSVAAAALLIDLLARVGRLPALAGVVYAVVLVVPSLIPDIEPSWFWVVVTVLSFVALLLVSAGRRPSRAGVVSGVAALLVAGVVTSLLPATVGTPLTGVGNGTGISTGVNPAINLGNDLRRGTPVDVLSYTTTSTSGEYLKLVDLVDFSGRSWSPAKVTLNSANDVTALPAAPGVAATTRRTTETTDLSISALRSPYLPLPVPASKVTGIDSKWKYVDASGVTIRSTSEGSQGLDYTVVSRPVNPTEGQIVRSLETPTEDMSAYLSVAGVPASITRLAKQVTADAQNPFDRAVALQDYFREGDFTYSENTPVEGGYDGTGLEAIVTFLERKSGYCVHFASAMAVMARTLGIPSRIAVGFLPGSQASTGTDSPWQVTSNDLHTWPELYFQGLGWVPFEPTVGQGTTASYLQQTGTEATAQPTVTPSATASATAAPTDAASATPTPTSDESASNAPTATTATASSVGSIVGIALGVVVVVLLLLLPFWLRGARRRRRLGQGPPDAALAAWREVVDTARDLGVAVDAGATPQATAALLRGVLRASGAPVPVAAGGASPPARPVEAESALAALLDATEAERFGDRAAGLGVHEAARTVIEGLRAAATGRHRLLATFAPRSLFVEQRPRRPE